MMSSNNFLSNSMKNGWIRKSSSEEDRLHCQSVEKSKQQTTSSENTEDDPKEEKVLAKRVKQVVVVTPSPTALSSKGPSSSTPPPSGTSPSSSSGQSVGFIKNLWSAQRSFDAATSAAMRKLQMKTLVRNATSSCKSSQGLSPSSFPALRRPLVEDLDEDLFPIDGDSEILNEKDFGKLSKELPKRLTSATWKRTFSTSLDGFSLATVYRRMNPHVTRPALLVIRDTNGHRFGAFVSEAFHVREKSFGSGESFVFRMGDGDKGGFQVWKWTCKNDFFVLCSNSALCVGIDDGKFSIYLDESLFHGRSQKCQTFDNEPLTPTGDFQASSVEVWNFE